MVGSKVKLRAETRLMYVICRLAESPAGVGLAGRLCAASHFGMQVGRGVVHVSIDPYRITISNMQPGDVEALRAACDAHGFAYEYQHELKSISETTCSRGVPFDEDCGDCTKDACDEGPNLLDLVKQGLTVRLAPRVDERPCDTCRHFTLAAMCAVRSRCVKVGMLCSNFVERKPDHKCCGTSKPLPRRRRSKGRRFARIVRKVERRGSGVRNL